MTIDRDALIEVAAGSLRENVGTVTRYMYGQLVLDAVLPLIADAIEARCRNGTVPPGRLIGEVVAYQAGRHDQCAADARLVRSLGGGQPND